MTSIGGQSEVDVTVPMVSVGRIDRCTNHYHLRFVRKSFSANQNWINYTDRLTLTAVIYYKCFAPITMS